MAKMPERLKPVDVHPGWRKPPDPPVPVLLTPRDLVLLQWLADWRYGSTQHMLEIAAFPSFTAGTTRLSRLHRAGYLTSLRLKWPADTVTAVWALTDAGGRILAEYVPTWAARARDWASPVTRPALRHHIHHELGRNAVVLALQAEAARRGAIVTVWPDTAGTLRAQVPQTGLWVNLTPDAVIDVNGQPWYLEYERSWRRDTLQHKTQQFGVALRHELWREHWVRAPKLLVVADEVGTQDYRIDTWLREMDAARLSALAYLPAAAVEAGRWEAVTWTAAGERQAVDWWELAGRTLPLGRPAIRPRRR